MRSRRGASTTASTGTPPDTPTGSARFDERLSVPLWWWVPALVLVGLVWLDLRIGHPSWPAWLAAVVLVPAFALSFHRLGRTSIQLRGSADSAVLRVGPASLPIRFISDASVLNGEDKRTALGPGLDPAAYLVQRAWIRPLVRVTLNDPDDPTPYWLFSARRPEALVECLRASRSSPPSGGGDPAGQAG